MPYDAKPLGRYLCSKKTLDKAQLYLTQLNKGQIIPGNRLAEVLAKAKANYEITPKQLIAFLMNTRYPRFLAEREAKLDGQDWNIQENAILADVIFSTTDTHSYNNGAHDSIHKRDGEITYKNGGRERTHRNHDQPLPTNFLFVSSALLANERNAKTSDMLEVVSSESTSINEEAFYKLYERRLLPGLLAQNALAKKRNTPLVITIPGLGCGHFAGKYRAGVTKALPRVLKKLFETHSDNLDMVYTVSYDPYYSSGEESKFTSTVHRANGTVINLRGRAYYNLPEYARASQLEFPKDGVDYTGCQLLKIVAWDPFSYPGNDLWANDVENGDYKDSDDGVTFASSDALLAMVNMGQFGSAGGPKVKMEYNTEHGIAYPRMLESVGAIGYHSFARVCLSTVTPDMIDFVSQTGELVADLQSIEPVSELKTDERYRRFTTSITDPIPPTPNPTSSWHSLMFWGSALVGAAGLAALIIAFALFDWANPYPSPEGILTAACGGFAMILGAVGMFCTAPTNDAPSTTPAFGRNQ